MAKVGIVMGSDSDMPVMAQAAEFLTEMGIDYEMRIISAHREPRPGRGNGAVNAPAFAAVLSFSGLSLFPFPGQSGGRV